MRPIPPRDRRGLRQFGLLVGSTLVALFGVIVPWAFSRALPVWPWITGGTLIAWAVLHPASLAPVYTGWMRLAMAISRVTTPLVLGLLFFLVITPVAWVLRLFGRDLMARGFDRASTTYRTPSRPLPARHIERPF